MPIIQKKKKDEREKSITYIQMKFIYKNTNDLGSRKKSFNEINLVTGNIDAND